MNVIGIDVSKLTLSCFDGKNYFEIENNKKAIASFVIKAAKNNTRFIYEATGPYSLVLDLESINNEIPVFKHMSN